MGGGIDDEAHQSMRPVLFRGSSGYEGWIGIVLSERGEEHGIPLSDPAGAPEVVLVKRCGEPGISGDGEGVEHCEWCQSVLTGRLHRWRGHERSERAGDWGVCVRHGRGGKAMIGGVCAVMVGGSLRLCRM